MTAKGGNILLWRKGQTVMRQSEYDEMKRVCVTVEGPGEDDYKVDLWRGPTVRRIHRAARKYYPKGCTLAFGRWF